MNSSAGQQYYWYTFRVRQQAPGGMVVLDGGNGPEPSDLTAWAEHSYETNADGETNSEDLYFMLENVTNE